MALFRVTSRIDGTTLLIRAKCLSCARQVAAQEAKSEGTLIWRDPTKSSVELIRPDDKPGLILRSEGTSHDS